MFDRHQIQVDKLHPGQGAIAPLPGSKKINSREKINQGSKTKRVTVKDGTRPKLPLRPCNISLETSNMAQQVEQGKSPSIIRSMTGATFRPKHTAETPRQINTAWPPELNSLCRCLVRLSIVLRVSLVGFSIVLGTPLVGLRIVLGIPLI